MAERDEWLSEVSPALEKDPRQIILIHHGTDLAGFVMYYTRGELLMIEELQLVPKYQRTLLCYKTVKYLCEFLGEKIERIEAYALKSNQTSIRLMQDLGFANINDTLGTKFLHFSSDSNKIKSNSTNLLLFTFKTTGHTDFLDRFISKKLDDLQFL